MVSPAKLTFTKGGLPPRSFSQPHCLPFLAKLHTYLLNHHNKLKIYNQKKKKKTLEKRASAQIAKGSECDKYMKDP